MEEKYTYEFKCQIVQEYLSGTNSYAGLAKKYSIPAQSNIEKWVNLYKNQGAVLLETGKGRQSFSFEFKKHVVELYLSTKNSYQSIANMFNFKDPSLVCKWVKKYQASGWDALKSNTIGKTDTMSTSTSNKNLSETEKELLRLKEENMKLKIENAYLKELRRMRLEEETLQKQQQELSAVSEESSN